MHISDLEEVNEAPLRRVSSLVSPFGLVSSSTPLYCKEGEPQFAIHTSMLGNPSKVLGNLREWRHSPSMGNFDGAGGALTRDRARLISIAESLERYSSCAWSEGDLVFATEGQIGDTCVPPGSWPTCSESELSNAKSGLAAYDSRLPIRWAKGWSLTNQREVYVPASLVYLHFPALSRSEMFTHSVSTGTAVHHDVRTAVLNGLTEVVERDAISLVWLQRMQLPEIQVDVDRLGEKAREYYKTGMSTNLKVRLFDATTDFGIPVIYGVQTSDEDAQLSQVVAATCDVSPENALAKIYRELASLRIALRTYAGLAVAENASEHEVSVIGGAVVNAQPHRRDAFDFLLNNGREPRLFADLPTLAESADPLTESIARLRSRGAEAIVVDITTDEARQIGMTVVKVLIPQAMPLSFVHSARYLATPRLYDAPKAMGLAVHPPSEINSDIQPFA